MTLHKGYRNKSRSKYRKKVRKRGLGSIEKYLLDFEPGDKVEIIADPSQHRRGMPHRRYHGRTGKIVDTRGRCFVVEVRLRNATKTLIAGREHLRFTHDEKIRKNII